MNKEIYFILVYRVFKCMYIVYKEVCILLYKKKICVEVFFLVVYLKILVYLKVIVLFKLI